MFYKMIEYARDRWYASTDCTIQSLIGYMTQQGNLRDAQIDAIKTYLFLKIGCENKPLSVLFSNGRFNSLNLDDLEISNKVRSYFAKHPAAAALYEYACLTNGSGEQVAEKVAKQIRTDVDEIPYMQFFQKAFYGVSYTDYLFSLPMGAGKTYLMAAFIYLDLYFASNEPDNPAFAHNFIILAPSGLKSSVVPSLKTIQKFDPAWVIPEPAASELKRLISFEVLDQGKNANKSNKIKNPNVQKIANHQPLSQLFGFVAVTNAEKVILDRIQESAKGMKTLEEWENYIEDYTKKLAEQAKKQETKREGIVISTLHAVKGLEYDKVYIMNVNEGSIPYKKAVLAESLEEERRLFYVGMTRAKKELMICYVRRQYDKERDPSRFLEETGL